MNTTVIEKKFNEMGARVKINKSNPRRRLNSNSNFAIDILRDSDGQYFDVQVKNEIEVLISDVQKKDRHLLLMTKDPTENVHKPEIKRFLCGHDEREWFTAAIPGAISTVIQAKQALKPANLQHIELLGGVKAKDLQKRRRKLASGGKIIRQGEFMFVPEPNLKVNENRALDLVFRNEPLNRGGQRVGKPHTAQFLHRRGGENVYVRGSRVISVADYEKITDSKEKRNWRLMKRNPAAFVKGKITHSDHATVYLGDVWHRVVVNTEGNAKGSENVVFLD